MGPDPRLLLIDASTDVEKQLGGLRIAGLSLSVHRVAKETTLTQAIDAPWDLAVLTCPLPFLSVSTIIETIRDRWPFVAILVISDPVGESAVAELMRRGADDFLLKNDLPDLSSAMERLCAEGDRRRKQALLERRETRRGLLLRILSEIDHAVIRIPLAEDLLRQAASLACRLGPFDRVRVTQKRDQLLLSAADAGQGDAPPLFWEKHVLANGRMLVNNDLEQGGEGGFSLWGSAALFPMRVNEGVWGCLGFYSRNKGAFEPEDAEVLGAMADDLSLGLRSRIETADKRETEQFLSDMTNLMPGLVFKLSFQPGSGFHFLYVSPGIDLLLPLSPAQVRADAARVFRSLHPGDRLRFYRAGMRSRNFLTVFSLEFRVVRPNGTVVWVLATGFPQKQADGSVIWTGLAIDVTPQNKLQEALLREQELVTVILNNIGDGVVAVDEQGQLALVNPAAARLLEGGSGAEGYWTSLDPHLPWDARDRFRPWFRRQEDGTVLHLEAHVSDLASPGKGLRGRVLPLRDMTERDRIEERLRQSEKLESIGLLAGGVAHDFNNLMTGMFGFVQLARLYADDAERVISYLDQALGPFQRARTLTQQLLTFARGGEPHRDPLVLDQVLPGILEFSLSGSPVSWKLPQYSGLWPVLANEAQLHQVFENLFLNAKQAMPSGGEVVVSLANVEAPGPVGRGLEPGPYLEITVLDNGPGIPADSLPKIFDPFFTTKASGTGLGLSICFSVVKKHFGTIEVGAGPTGGTLFRIFWPAAIPAAAKA